MTLTNTTGAHRHGTPNPIGDQWNIQVPYFSTTGTIAANAAVAMVWDNTLKVMKVEALDTDATGQSASVGYGVTVEALTATKTGMVVIAGYAEVAVGTATAAEGSAVIGTTTAGVAGVVAPDATTVVGTIIGTFLAAKNTSNIAPMWVGKQ